MAVSVVTGNDSVSSTSNNESDKLGILGKVKAKLQNGVKSLTEGRCRKLATIGQVAGTVGIVAGGTALIGAGIFSSATSVGLPLGISLIGLGSILLVAGTGFAIGAAVKNKNNKTFGAGVKDVFKQTLQNVTKGLKLAASIVKWDNLDKASKVATDLNDKINNLGEDKREGNGDNDVKQPSKTTQQTSIDQVVEQKKQGDIESFSGQVAVGLAGEAGK